MHRYSLTKGAAIGRALLASAGGYALALCFSAGGAVVLGQVFGMSRADAFVLAAMLAFLVWMLAVLVAYAAASARRAAAWIIGGALLCLVLGWSLGPLPAAGA